MSNSSQPEDYSITLTDTLTGTTFSNVTLNNSIYTAGSTTIDFNNITLSTGTPSSYSFSGVTSINAFNTVSVNDIRIKLPEEWVDCLPDFQRIESMCKEYPGLKIAFDKFKTTYKLVKDDYDTPKDKRPKP
jgi:hypothetical protein